MCGIVGFIDLKQAALGVSKDLAKFAYEALLMDTVRGYDGTGAVAVLENGRALYYKRGLAGFDFVNTKNFGKMLNKFATTNAFIGHNRSATSGAVDDNTAHPFRYGDITLVHNGTLDWVTGLNAPKEIDVDSAEIAWALSQEGPDVVLPKISGAYVLVWHNAKDNTIHFARNNERPLYIMHNKADDKLFFGSDKDILEGSLNNRISGEKNFGGLEDPYLLAPGKHVTVPLGKDVKGTLCDRWTLEDFVPYVKPVSSNHGYGHWNNWGNDVKKENRNPDKGNSIAGAVLKKYGLCRGAAILFNKQRIQYTQCPDTCNVLGSLITTHATNKITNIHMSVLARKVEQVEAKSKDTIFSAIVESAYYSAEQKKDIVVVTSCNMEGNHKTFRKGDFDYLDEAHYPELYSAFLNGQDDSDIPEDDGEEESKYVVLRDGSTMLRITFDHYAKGGCSWCTADLDGADPAKVGWYDADTTCILCPECSTEELENQATLLLEHDNNDQTAIKNLK